MTAGEVLKKSLFGGWIFLFCLLLVNLAGGLVTPRTPSLSKRTLTEAGGFRFRRNIFSEPTKPIPGPEKNYTGIRVKHDSLLVLYYHEQTVAIVEVAPNRTLFNCELLEVRTKEDQRVALKGLKTVVPTQMEIDFSDMMDLIVECQKLNPPLNFRREFTTERHRNDNLLDPKQFSTLFSGIFPGTKWCGPGDIAATYHDLGHEKEVDRCCRSHDFCPVKVAGLRTQYSLTNYAFYTRSHCTCDGVFFDCLMSVGTTASRLLRDLYFVAPVTCIVDAEDDKNKKRFVIKRWRF